MEAYQRLEREFAAKLALWQGVKAHEHVVACSSGTSAIHLALESLPIPKGMEVIVPDFTMVACPRAVTLAGLTPVFVDCGEDLLIDPELAAQAVSDKTAAIMPVHIYGRRCDMRAVIDLATKHDLFVIEDMAEAHGVAPHSGSDAACWSFYRNKITAGEEGGAVAFHDPAAAALARQLRCLGFTDAHDFRHIPRGMNYRLANSLASLIIDSLRRVDDNLRARRMIEGWYNAACPEEWRMPPRDVCWVMDVRLPGMTEERQAETVRRLNEAGIAARMAFKPMSEQEEYRDCRLMSKGVAWRMSREVLYLPVVPGETTQEAVRLAFEVLSFARGGKE